MIDRFRDCLEFVLLREGRVSKHKADRGGLTNYGITQKTYDAWRTRRGLTLCSVREIDMSEVRGIYQGEYWEPAKCRLLWCPLDLVVFDSAVQHGPGRASRWLQQVVGAEQDGRIGPRTLTSLANYTNENGKRGTAQHYMDIRSAFYEQIIDNDPTQEVFRKGWKNRVDALMNVVKAYV